MARRGRPRLCSDGLLRRVLAMRHEGMSYQTICDMLNAEGAQHLLGDLAGAAPRIPPRLHAQCPGNGAGESEGGRISHTQLLTPRPELEYDGVEYAALPVAVP
jgi:hypothetical protein